MLALTFAGAAACVEGSDSPGAPPAASGEGSSSSSTDAVNPAPSATTGTLPVGSSLPVSPALPSSAPSTSSSLTVTASAPSSEPVPTASSRSSDEPAGTDSDDVAPETHEGTHETDVETPSVSSGEPPTTDSELPELPPAQARITFGTPLDATSVVAQARERARAATDPAAAGWRATGDQRRTYRFEETNQSEPYRLYVPTNWDKQSKLPLVVFLHGAGSDENTYVDQNGGQMIRLAQEHGFILVSPKGAAGAYGNFLRLSAPFGNPQGAAELMANVTPESQRTNELSEMDVIHVIERVIAEYPVDPVRMFLTGHSMGSGGTWYIGGKYATYWRGIAPMSGPFVQETGYPWSNLSEVSIFVTEGTQTPSLDASRLLADWLERGGFDSRYEEVNADHGGMVPLVLPNVFAYFAALGPN